MPRPQTTIKSLVLGFGNHSQALKAPDYKESQARLHYIDPFWELLGWDVSNQARHGSRLAAWGVFDQPPLSI